MYYKYNLYHNYEILLTFPYIYIFIKVDHVFPLGMHRLYLYKIILY